MTPKAFSEFSAGIKLPRSMELNIPYQGHGPDMVRNFWRLWSDTPV
jgi:hypothetical protein